MLFPQATIPKAQYYAWLPYWSQSEVTNSLNSSSNKLKNISPFWYQLQPSGEVAFKSGVSKDQILRIAKQKNLKIIPSIFNELDPTRSNKFLSSQELQDKAMHTLIQDANDFGFSGFDLDLEELNLTDILLYQAFIQKFSQALKQNNLIVSITVHARVGDYTDRPSAAVQDYPEIAKYADQVRIMAYDFHNQTSNPGPITPIDRLRPVLDYAKKTIPQDKIILGLPLYGYQWGSAKGTALTYSDIAKIIKDQNLTPKLDQSAKTFNFSKDGKTYTVWYEDSQTTYAKIKIAQEYGIYQFSFWRLGGEDPTLWQNLP